MTLKKDYNCEKWLLQKYVGLHLYLDNLYIRDIIYHRNKR